MPGWFGSTFASLAVRDFRVLWLGTLFSFIAFFMSTVVQSVVAFELTGRNQAVGWVVFAQGVAMLLLGPLGGAFADRWPKRRVVATGQLVTFCVFATLAALVAAGTIRVLDLALGSLVMGATFAFLGPARQAMVVDLVGPGRRGNAMALSQVANSASRVVGPGLAGVMLGWSFAGATGAYLTMAALYGISAASLLLLPRSRVRPDANDTHVLHDVVGGITYVARQPRLRSLVLMFVLVIMTGFSYIALLPGLVENQLGRSARAISLLLLTSALGALTASLTLARFADSRYAVTIFTAMGGAYGLAVLGLARVPSYEHAVAWMLVVGATSGGFQSLSGAVIVRETDPAYIGRVMSLTMLAFAGFGLMGLPIGLAADSVGERTVLTVMGCVVCVLVVVFGLAIARTRSVVSTDARDRDALERFAK